MCRGPSAEECRLPGVSTPPGQPALLHKTADQGEKVTPIPSGSRPGKVEPQDDCRFPKRQIRFESDALQPD